MSVLCNWGAHLGEYKAIDDVAFYGSNYVHLGYTF